MDKISHFYFWEWKNVFEISFVMIRVLHLSTIIQVPCFLCNHPSLSFYQFFFKNLFVKCYEKDDDYVLIVSTIVLMVI